MTNIMLHNGELTYAEVLGERFAEQVPTTINFAFNSAVLDEQARAILREQAAFIRHFPEVRFTVIRPHRPRGQPRPTTTASACAGPAPR
jgi:peptidoglycan-associated lipoprotein